MLQLHRWLVKRPRGGCWGGSVFPAAGRGRQVALRFNEKFKFDSSLERGVLNIT